MTDKKISELDAASTPLAGTEVLPIVQSGATKKITANDLVGGRSNTFTANQIISVTDNTNAAFRVTQLGTGDAILVEDETNPDSSPFVVKADGKVAIGTTSSLTNLTVASTGANGVDISVDAGTTTSSGRLFFSNGTSGQSVALRNSSNDFIITTGATPGSATGTVRLCVASTGNIGVGTTSFGTSAVRVIAIANGTAPSSSPSGLGQLYVESGALKYRGSSGTITTIAIA